MKIIDNMTDLKFDTWQKSIKQIALYKHFKEEADEKSKIILEEIKNLDKITKKTEELEHKYVEKIEELAKVSSSIYENVEKNLENEELIQEICTKRNIDISIESYKRWLETGEKIKI